MNLTRDTVALVITFLVVVGFHASMNTAPAADSVPPPPIPSPSNPLIEEMRTLDKAFRDIVSAVALNDAGSARAAIASMHGAMEKTHEGIHEGTVVLPLNGGRIAEFVERDRKFHEMLEAMDLAANRNHPQEMLRITKLLLDGCVQCHRMFR
jgi:cytochrome c556